MNQVSRTMTGRAKSLNGVGPLVIPGAHRSRTLLRLPAVYLHLICWGWSRRSIAASTSNISIGTASCSGRDRRRVRLSNRRHWGSSIPHDKRIRVKWWHIGRSMSIRGIAEGWPVDVLLVLVAHGSNWSRGAVNSRRCGGCAVTRRSRRHQICGQSSRRGLRAQLLIRAKRVLLVIVIEQYTCGLQCHSG
jgi:hypothetical protein